MTPEDDPIPDESAVLLPTRWSSAPVEVPASLERYRLFADLRPRMLVCADLYGAADPRPVGDRHDIELTLERIEAERSRLRAELGSAFASVEPIWRALERVVASAGDEVVVTYVNLSKRDLFEDLEDSPEVPRWGFSWLVMRKNHQGMLPYTAVVLGFDFDPTEAKDRRLLRALGMVGARGAAPMVAGLAATAASPFGVEHEQHAAWRATRDASFVALAGPAYCLPGEPPLPGSLLAAELIARQARELRVGGPLRGVVTGVELATSMPTSVARDRGFLLFAPRPSGAALVVDSTAARRAPLAGSLSAMLLVTRACHEILLEDVFHFADLEPEQLAETWTRRVAQRFEDVPGVFFALRDAAWAGSKSLIEATLDLRVPAKVESGGVVLSQEVVLRTSRD